MQGKLYLIPTTIGDSEIERVIPAYNIGIISKIRNFIVEDVRTARRFLAKCGLKEIIDQSVFFELNQHTKNEDAKKFLAPAFDNNDVGLLSEAGTPCIADPGNIIVKLAHEKGIRVIPLSGPSSIILALMASGLNGQNFAFNGYLPVKPSERQKKIAFLEKLSFTNKQTQIFIEAPYRNIHLFNDIVNVCTGNTLFTVAVDITQDNEEIYTKTISEWKKFKIDLSKRPCIFMILKSN